MEEFKPGCAAVYMCVYVSICVHIFARFAHLSTMSISSLLWHVSSAWLIVFNQYGGNSLQFAPKMKPTPAHGRTFIHMWGHAACVCVCYVCDSMNVLMRPPGLWMSDITAVNTRPQSALRGGQRLWQHNALKHKLTTPHLAGFDSKPRLRALSMSDSLPKQTQRGEIKSNDSRKGCIYTCFIYVCVRVWVSVEPCRLLTKATRGNQAPLNQFLMASLHRGGRERGIGATHNSTWAYTLQCMPMAW